MYTSGSTGLPKGNSQSSHLHTCYNRLHLLMHAFMHAMGSHAWYIQCLLGTACFVGKKTCVPSPAFCWHSQLRTSHLSILDGVGSGCQLTHYYRIELVKVFWGLIHFHHFWKGFQIGKCHPPEAALIKRLSAREVSWGSAAEKTFR